MAVLAGIKKRGDTLCEKYKIKKSIR